MHVPVAQTLKRRDKQQISTVEGYKTFGDNNLKQI